MIPLTFTEAVALVRKNLDEVGLNDSIMYTTESTDNSSMDTTIKRTLPEAINAVLLAAPAESLEGDAIDQSAFGLPENGCVIEDQVVHFWLDRKILRIAAFKAFDSDVVVTDVISESSPEGRMQLNKYVRGTFDKPRLVRSQSKVHPADYKYYSLRETGGTFPIDMLVVIPYAEYDENIPFYNIPQELYWDVINRLTGMVLSIYGETEKAKYFIEQS